MKTKYCPGCEEEKALSEFSKNKSTKDGLHCWCKKCQEIYNKEYYKNNKTKLSKQTKEYRKNNPWKQTLANIKQRCDNPKNPFYKNYGGRGIKYLITSEELKELWFRDKAYDLKWGSIDREDNDGNYTYSNCRFIEMGENSAERNIRVSSKIVLQFDLEGNFIKEWRSGAEASKKLKIHRGHIGDCALGKIKTSGGFIWRYK